MQLPFAFDDGAATFADIHARLLARFGRQGPWHHLDPLSQLGLGIVGGRTRGSVSLSALEGLMLRFGSWDAVRAASYSDVRHVIGRVTFPDNKARYLREALRQIAVKRGRLELGFLAHWPVNSALTWLERLPGVGRKVSAATLNFSSLKMKALVIDSHHLRVMKRLGLLRRNAGFEEAYDRLMPRLPGNWTAADLDEHHQLVKLLGQTTCHHDLPACADCPLAALCNATTRGS